MSKELNLHRVLEVKELSKLSRSNEAKLLLDKIKNTVGPVMGRRKWTCKVLKEFYPDQQGLLGMNVNKGQSILIRLRKPENINEFFSWEHLIGTMVHELTHMVVGPHSAEFYKLMDEIHDEVDKDMISGNFTFVTASSNTTTVAFQGKGYKLGNGSNTLSSVHQSRTQLAKEAALKRLHHQKLMSGSGQTLASSSSSQNTSYNVLPLTKDELRVRAAEAAQRRIQDDVSCRHNNSVRENQTKASSSSSGSKYNNHDNKNSNIPVKSHTNKNSSSYNSIDDSFENLYWICSLCDTPNLNSLQSCMFCSSPQILLSETLPSSDIKSFNTNRSSQSNRKSQFQISNYINETLPNTGTYCTPCLSSSSLISEKIIVIDGDDVTEMSSQTVLAPLKKSKSDNNFAFVNSSIDQFIDLCSSSEVVKNHEDDAQWSCNVCTFLNQKMLHTCEICGEKRIQKRIKMSDSFTEKLYRLKSTCDERINRIIDVKQEIQHEEEQINAVLKDQISNLQVISLKYQTANLQLELENIKDDIENELAKQNDLEKKLHSLAATYQEAYKSAHDVSFKVVRENSSISYLEIDVTNKCSRYYESYLMSYEDYLSVANDINENDQHDRSCNDNLFQESGSWKKKVLHAVALEKSEIERKIRYFEGCIQSLICHIMEE